MTHIVLEPCIGCKDTRCVDVCEDKCFHEGPNFMVINPRECIDCGRCVDACEKKAIVWGPDVPVSDAPYIILNIELARKWPRIENSKPPLADAKFWKGRTGKIDFLELGGADRMGVQERLTWLLQYLGRPGGCARSMRHHIESGAAWLLGRLRRFGWLPERLIRNLNKWKPGMPDRRGVPTPLRAFTSVPQASQHMTQVLAEARRVAMGKNQKRMLWLEAGDVMLAAVASAETVIQRSANCAKDPLEFSAGCRLDLQALEAEWGNSAYDKYGYGEYTIRTIWRGLESG